GRRPSVRPGSDGGSPVRPAGVGNGYNPSPGRARPHGQHPPNVHQACRDRTDPALPGRVWRRFRPQQAKGPRAHGPWCRGRRQDDRDPQEACKPYRRVFRPILPAKARHLSRSALERGPAGSRPRRGRAVRWQRPGSGQSRIPSPSWMWTTSTGVVGRPTSTPREFAIRQAPTIGTPKFALDRCTGTFRNSWIFAASPSVAFGWRTTPLFVAIPALPTVASPATVPRSTGTPSARPIAATTSFENSGWTIAPESFARTLFPIAFNRWRTIVTRATPSRAFRSWESRASPTTQPFEFPAMRAPTTSL